MKNTDTLARNNSAWGVGMKNLVFDYGTDINKTAYVNWRTRRHQPIYDMIVLAEGYMKSALMLAKDCLTDNSDKKADIVIYPMLFSVNHSIELYLKSINWSLNILLGYREKYVGGHDIMQIWNTVKSRVYEYESDCKENKKQFKKMTESLKKYINELEGKLNTETAKPGMMNMDFSRYPINDSNEYHFYLETYENVVVDLEYFLKVFSEIGDNLNSISGYYEEKAAFALNGE